MFKKLFLIITFIITTSFTKYGVGDEIYVNWQPSNSGYWSYYNTFNIYSDFDYMISKSAYPDKYGYYTFYFCFYSQSHYWDGRNATYTSTNIRNITVHLNEGNGNKLICYDYTPLGISFFGQYCPPNLIFKSRYSRPMIIIRWGSMSAI